MATKLLSDVNTRFALPIICPTTGEIVSAETLYNRACTAMGRQIDSHIGDLIFDNLDYDSADLGTDAANEALHDAVYAWAARVKREVA